MAGKSVSGSLEMHKNDSRRLLIGEHVVISVKPTHDAYHTNIEPAIPKIALITYSSMAAAHFTVTKNPYVLPIEHVESADVTEVLLWIIKTCETGKPIKITNTTFNSIANNARKLDLAKRLGIEQLETFYTTTIKDLLKTKNIYALDAKEVYEKYPPLSPICWQVAKNMAVAIRNKDLSKVEGLQYTRLQYAIPNLYDNIKIHLAELEKSAGKQ